MEISILHISHGIIKTGGFRHEQSLLKELTSHFSSKGFHVKDQTIRAERFFKGLAQLNLFVWAFRKCNANINIVVGRTALSAILRNIFTQNKILIVLHNDDKTDGKGLLLRLYYEFLFFILKLFPFKRIAIIAVADFWVKHFQKRINENIPVLLYPNLLDTAYYTSFKTGNKQKRIHLGQYSSKNNMGMLLNLAKSLNAMGYENYFTTLDKEEETIAETYSVICEPFDEYLKRMASSMYTLAMVRVNEGWNRVAHESILVGTPVIGLNKGGLGDLLTYSGSFMVASGEEVLDIIVNTKKAMYNDKFVEEYDISQSKQYLNSVINFIER